VKEDDTAGLDSSTCEHFCKVIGNLIPSE